MSVLPAQSGRVLDAVVAERRGRDNGRSPPFIFGHCSGNGSTEREHESLDAGIEEPDLELTLVDRLLLSYQLIQTLVDCGAVALSVDVQSVRGGRRFAVEEHAKAHRSSA